MATARGLDERRNWDGRTNPFWLALGNCGGLQPVNFSGMFNASRTYWKGRESYSFGFAGLSPRLDIHWYRDLRFAGAKEIWPVDFENGVRSRCHRRIASGNNRD